MVSSSGKRLPEVLENGAAVVHDLAGLSVHEVRRANHLSCKGRSQRLMSQTHSENRQLACEVTKYVHADARFVGCAGAWGDHNALGMQGFDLANSHLVVTSHDYVRTKFSQVLHQVVGERVVIVQDENHVCSQQVTSNSAHLRQRENLANGRHRPKFSLTGGRRSLILTMVFRRLPHGRRSSTSRKAYDPAVCAAVTGFREL